ncbi:MAG: hypothetical protein AAF581_01295 [Planctomycetota bacterium]
MLRMPLCFVVCLLTANSYSQGQFVYTVHGAVGRKGTLFTQDVSLGVTNDSSVGGWSYSVCHDPTRQDVCGVATTPFAVSFNPIGPPFFLSAEFDDAATTVPGSTDGASQGMVIGPGGFFFFDDNTAGVVLTVTYLALTDTGTSTTEICSTVGNPPVEAVVVCCGGQLIPIGTHLSTVGGTVTYSPATPLWTFQGADQTREYDPDTGHLDGNSVLSVELDIANTAANFEYRDTAGYSISILHDSTLLTPVSVDLGATPAGLVQATFPQVLNCEGPGSLGPDIVLANITSSGVSIHVQNTALPAIPVFPYCLKSIDWGGGDTAAVIEYTVAPGALIGNTTSTTTMLTFADVGDGVGNSVTLSSGGSGLSNNGTYSAPNLVAVTAPDAVVLDDISVSFVPVADLDFIRSDCNSDGVSNVADIVWLIAGYLALPAGGPEGSCEAACDGNGDQHVDVADVSFLLAYQFAGGPPPPAPFPNCDASTGAPCEASPCP